MKVALFSCLVILLCTLAVTNKCLETAMKIRGFDVSKHLASALERDCNSFITNIIGDTSNFELAKTKDFILDIE